MNLTNALGTVTAILTGVSAIMMEVLSCELLAGLTAKCDAAFLTPRMAAWSAAGFAIVTILLKIVRPGGVLRSLFGSTAVVVPDGKGSPGVVTKAQVAAK